MLFDFFDFQLPFRFASPLFPVRQNLVQQTHGPYLLLELQKVVLYQLG